MIEIVVFQQSLLLSLSAVGGAMALLPEIARVAVEQQWATPAELAHLAALGQAAPGPNMLIVTLVGWQAAGLVGALLATVAFCLPSAAVILAVFPKWEAFRNAPWRKAVQSTLAALAVGMVLSGAVAFAQLSLTGVGGLVVMLVAAVVAWKTKVPPVAIIAGGAIAGLMGLV